MHPLILVRILYSLNVLSLTDTLCSVSPETLLSSVIAVCTAVYTYINWQQLRESRINRRLKSTPHLICYLDRTLEDRMIIMRIKNVGEGYAESISASFEQNVPLPTLRDQYLRTTKLARNGLKIIPAGGVYDEALGFHEKVYADDSSCKDAHIDVHLLYHDMYGAMYSYSTRLEFNQLSFFYIVKDDHIKSIDTHLREISNTLDGMSKK